MKIASASNTMTRVLKTPSPASRAAPTASSACVTPRSPNDARTGAAFCGGLSRLARRAPHRVIASQDAIYAGPLPMTYRCFNVEIANNVAHLQLKRGDELNTMVPEFWRELP